MDQRVSTPSKFGKLYLLPLLAVLCIIALLYIVAHSYPTPKEFGLDKLLHFLGGFAAPLIILLFIRVERFVGIIIMSSTLIIGFEWELLEHAIPWMNNYSPHSMTSVDTLGDLIFDTLGGTVAWIWYRLWLFLAAKK